ncbi:MAG: ParA family partition ATPase [Pseudotabrizicola sp.]|uniref:ParA family partition ATPase n=1 Tax=Pseudotabrizicola sp. TaxID=2939647 RepID=UPI00271FF6BD|nr:ParA family partition ATPase [Pseudotabrizicola sp.]MDO9637571.1 ParA family partition ATPase [Pseudotabrizicola sp.]
MGQVITVAQQKGGSGKTTLSVNLAVELVRRGVSVALLDTDPQGSLGRWFMARRDRLGDPGMDLSTASAWGVGYECEKLRKTHDVVIIDTPPKIDADLRPSLREASLVLIPVSASHVDLWATDGVLDLAARESRPVMIVLNRCKAGTRLGEEVANAAGDLAEVASARLGQRVGYAETMGNGLAVAEVGKSPAAGEIAALATEVMARLQS